MCKKKVEESKMLYIAAYIPMAIMLIAACYQDQLCAIICYVVFVAFLLLAEQKKHEECYHKRKR